jgi:hypothetical protein
MNWEDVVKNKNSQRISIENGIREVYGVVKSLYRSVDGFMRDSDEEDGPYQEAQVMKTEITNISKEIASVERRILRLLNQYEEFYREQEYIG